MSGRFQFLISAISVIGMGLLQNTNLISFFGVKPNLVLVAVLVMIFFAENFWQYTVLLLGGVAMLGFSGLEREVLTLIFLCLVAFGLRKYLIHHSLAGAFLLSIFSTIAFYFLIGGGISALAISDLVLEAVLNGVIGLFVYYLFNIIYEKTGSSG